MKTIKSKESKEFMSGVENHISRVANNYETAGATPAPDSIFKKESKRAIIHRAQGITNSSGQERALVVVHIIQNANKVAIAGYMGFASDWGDAICDGNFTNLKYVGACYNINHPAEKFYHSLWRNVKRFLPPKTSCAVRYAAKWSADSFNLCGVHWSHYHAFNTKMHDFGHIYDVNGDYYAPFISLAIHRAQKVLAESKF